MKKIIICIIALFCFISVNSENTVIKLNITAGAARVIPAGWSKWIPTSLKGEWRVDEGRIIIYSQETQFIDYSDPVVKETKDYMLITSQNATDTDNKDIFLEIYIYKSGSGYLKLIYNDAEIKYKMYRALDNYE
jgi:hypothetical protein